MTTASSDIAIIGFGFGGLMVLANTVRTASKPLSITIFAEDSRGVGMAYGTTNTLHLLNVPARNMGAWAHDIADFTHWLKTVHAEMVRETLGLKTLPGTEDFAPRALYAHYLATMHRQTIEAAQKKNITITFVAETVTGMQREKNHWKLASQTHDVTAKQVVIATGNEVKPMFPQMPHPAIIENPWLLTEVQVQQFGNRPLVMIGTGLTSVDIILSLRRMGYTGTVHAISRNGLLPLPHKPYAATFTLDAQGLLAQTTLLGLLRFVRGAIRTHARTGGDWRAVIDALRPHAITIWQRLSPRDQRSFIRRLATLWNSHRHRMAPDIAVIMQQEIANGKLQLAASHHFHPSADGEKIKLAVQWLHGGQEVLQPAAILNCAGPELNWSRSNRPLLKRLLADGHVTAHPTNIGVVASAHYAIGDHLYAIGNPMTGQFWESTAVPELRVQAAAVGASLCQ